MSTYWFKPKRYGYGAMPVTWQGWALVSAAVAAIVAAAVLIRPYSQQSPWAWFAFFGVEALVLAALWVVARRKTDGEWRWRWSDR